MAFYKKRRFSKKYSLKSRRGRFGRLARKTGGSFKARVTKILMKASETKHYDIADENVQLYHNQGAGAGPGNPQSLAQIFNPWSNIAKGTGRYDRIGDKVTPRGMALTLWIANKSDRPNIMYRLIVARVPKAIRGLQTTSGNVYPFESLTQLGGIGNKMVLPIDKDTGIRALYDRTFNVQTGFSAISAGQGKECHKTVKLWIKSKRAREIQFDSQGQFISNNPLMIWVIPYDSYGTLVTDNVASCAYYGRIYYKDV